MRMIKLPSGNYVNAAHVVQIRLESHNEGVQTVLEVALGARTHTYFYPGDCRAMLATLINGAA